MTAKPITEPRRRASSRPALVGRLDLVERVAEQQRRDRARPCDAVGRRLAQQLAAGVRVPDQRDDLVVRRVALHRVLERALGQQLALRRRGRLGRAGEQVAEARLRRLARAEVEPRGAEVAGRQLLLEHRVGAVEHAQALVERARRAGVVAGRVERLAELRERAARAPRLLEQRDRGAQPLDRARQARRAPRRDRGRRAARRAPPAAATRRARAAGSSRRSSGAPPASARLAAACRHVTTHGAPTGSVCSRCAAARSSASAPPAVAQQPRRREVQLPALGGRDPEVDRLTHDRVDEAELGRRAQRRRRRPARRRPWRRRRVELRERGRLRERDVVAEHRDRVRQPRRAAATAARCARRPPARSSAGRAPRRRRASPDADAAVGVDARRASSLSSSRRKNGLPFVTRAQAAQKASSASGSAAPHDRRDRLLAERQQLEPPRERVRRERAERVAAAGARRPGAGARSARSRAAGPRCAAR